MAIQLLGFPTTLGLARKAQKHGPEAMRSAGLTRLLESHGQTVQDLGNMDLEEGRVEDPAPERVRKVVATARRQAALWQQMHKPGDLMLTLGGDHTTSLGTICALAAAGESFDVVWIDAHGDFNVLETSPSGNPHGMVLALACGLLPDFLPRQVDPEQLRLWGIRSLDSGERKLLEREQVEVLTPDQVRHERERIISRLKPNVFLSFDIDSVDPPEAPGTWTPIPAGFHRHEALELVAEIARQRRLLALDIVEFHPDRDRNDLTLDLALAVAETAVTGRVALRQRPGFDAAAGT